MSAPAPRTHPATYQDVLDAPAHRVAQVIGGVLYTHPRPATPHAQAASTLGEELGPPFKRGRGGPGGWIILYEPELHLGPAAGPDIVVPDLAGWRRETLPELPEAPYLTVPPDWACEVLSPSTRRLDRVRKVPLFAREGVGHVWLVDPAAKTLEVLRLAGGAYAFVAAYAEAEVVRAEPFDAIELRLEDLWMR